MEGSGWDDPLKWTQICGDQMEEGGIDVGVCEGGAGAVSRRRPSHIVLYVFDFNAR